MSQVSTNVVSIPSAKSKLSAGTVAKKTATKKSAEKKAVKKVAKKTSKSKVPSGVQTAAKKTLDNAATGAAKAIASKSKAKPTAEPTRQYGLDSDRIAELKKDKAYNPYRESSSYWLVVESLHSLGVGKFHTGADLIAEYVKTADKDALKNFKNKDKRNEATAQDWKGKILTNAYVVTRNDYGKKLRDIGWEVRQERRDDGHVYGLFRLTNGKK